MKLEERYRPRRFEDVVGQDKVVEAVRRRVAAGRAHTLLFSGPLGTGKTTMVRIVAGALLCEEPSDGSPCGVCAACRDYNADDHENWSEYNGSSMSTGDVDDLIESRYKPPRKGPRVAFIDEVHRLHPRSWVRLLTELEAPGHRVFLFASSESQDIPQAALQRLTHYKLGLVDQKTAVEHLRFVCEREGIRYDLGGLHTIARLSEGSPRLLLQHLDKVADEGAMADTVLAGSGLSSYGLYAEMWSALLREDIAVAHRVDGEIKEKPVDKATMLRIVLGEVYQSEILNLFVGVSAQFGVSEAQWAGLAAALKGHAERHGCSVEALVSALLGKLEQPTPRPDAPWFSNLLIRLVGLIKTAPADPSPTYRPVRPRSLRTSRTVVDVAGEYLAAEKVSSIIDAATYVAQVYGRTFNIRLVLLHGRLGLGEEGGADLVAATLHKLGMRIQAWTGKRERLHYIYMHQKADAVGLVTTVAISVAPERIDAVEAWFLKVIRNHLGVGVGRRGVRLSFCRSRDPEHQMRFHWSSLRLLCRTADPALSVPGGDKSLLNVLRVPRRLRQPLGDVGLPHLVRMSESLAIPERRKAKPSYLSAYKNGAWPWLTRGWELTEYQDRNTFLQLVNDQQDALREALADADEITRRGIILKLEKLAESVVADARQRKRSQLLWLEH